MVKDNKDEISNSVFDLQYDIETGQINLRCNNETFQKLKKLLNISDDDRIYLVAVNDVPKKPKVIIWNR